LKLYAQRAAKIVSVERSGRLNLLSAIRFLTINCIFLIERLSEISNHEAHYIGSAPVLTRISSPPSAGWGEALSACSPVKLCRERPTIASLPPETCHEGAAAIAIDD
jgi:hypothetical protein